MCIRGTGLLAESIGRGANISRYYISGEFADRADALLTQIGYDGIDDYYRSFPQVADPVHSPRARSGDEVNIYEQLTRRCSLGQQ